MGLKPSLKTPLFNGPLECEYRKYQLFDGKMKEFRSEGGIIKTDEERKAMAEKHRFRKNREFKKRLDDDLENEEGDIRTFRFNSFERDYRGQRRKEPQKHRTPRSPKGAAQRRAIFGKHNPKNPYDEE